MHIASFRFAIATTLMIRFSACGLVFAEEHKSAPGSMHVGDVLNYTVTEKQDISIAGKGQVLSEFVTDLRLVVKDMDSSGNSIEVTYMGFSAKVVAQGTTMAYDSRTKKGTNPQLQEAVQDLVGRTLALRLDRDGTIIGITGFPKIKQSLAGRVFGGVLDEEMVKRSFRKLLPSGVERSRLLSKGEQWTALEETDLDEYTKFVLRFHHTVEDVDEKASQVQVTGDAILAGASRAKHLGDLSVSAPEVRGSIVWDRERSLVSRHEMHYLVNLRRELNGQMDEVLRVGVESTTELRE